jgi:3-dehydroquinate dehydratase-1
LIKKYQDFLNTPSIISMKTSQTFGIHSLLAEGRPLVVGTVHNASGLSLLKRAGTQLSGLDLLEVRLDGLVRRALPATWGLPVIATARHPAEGGEGNLSVSQRRKLLGAALPWAAAVDVELRSAEPLASVIASAHQLGRTVILSHHDFKATPTRKVLCELVARAGDAGADLFKIATLIRNPEDLRRMIDLQMDGSEIPVAAMGMGPAGKFSRIVLCGFGASLCYGWLGKPQVPGQWPALQLAEVLAGVLPA